MTCLGGNSSGEKTLLDPTQPQAGLDRGEDSEPKIQWSDHTIALGIVIQDFPGVIGRDC